MTRAFQCLLTPLTAVPFFILATSVLAKNQVVETRYRNGAWKALFREAYVPPYPSEERRKRITGKGLYRMDVDEKGKITAMTIVTSTGNRNLDVAVLKTFIRWRMKPGLRRQVDIPVIFVMDKPPGPGWADGVVVREFTSPQMK